jgi:hypothetical protein
MQRVRCGHLRRDVRRGRRVSAVVALVLAIPGAVAAITPITASALQGSVVLSAVPSATTAQAIAYLNAQRAANGIPGNLTDDAQMSQGCEEYANLYKPKPGQYPHEEIEGQPGYTPAGNTAAASSDLDGSPGHWSATVNPWDEAPLHLRALFDPAATTTWYGEKHGSWGEGAACMGTGGEQAFSTPTFFSMPGNGVTDVHPSETASEEPFTPGEAVGIPEGTATGPYIILWPEGTDATLQTATLQGPAGESVPVKLVTSETLAPGVPAGWPAWPTVGGDYVIPTTPLKFASAYILTATWANPAGAQYVQTEHFTTVASHQAQVAESITDENCSSCAHGYLKADVIGNKVRFSISPVGDQTLTVQIWRGQVVCVSHIHGKCHGGQLVADNEEKRTIKARSATTVMALPRKLKSTDNAVEIIVIIGRFTAQGQQWEGGKSLALRGG